MYPPMLENMQYLCFKNGCLYFIEALSIVSASKTNVDSALTQTSFQ